MSHYGSDRPISCLYLSGELYYIHCSIILFQDVDSCLFTAQFLSLDTRKNKTLKATCVV